MKPTDTDLFGEVPKTTKRPVGRPPKSAAARKKAAKRKTAKKKTKKRAKKKAAPKKTAPAKKADVVDLPGGVLLSISQLSQETGFTRETIRKRIASNDVNPAGKRRGYDVYRLRDAIPALFEATAGEVDPDKMDPFKRRAYYQGELDKLKLQTEAGELVPSFEVEATFGQIFKTLTQALDTWPDIIERDVGASPQVVHRLELAIDELRSNIYSELTTDEPGQAEISA